MGPPLPAARAAHRVCAVWAPDFSRSVGVLREMPPTSCLRAGGGWRFGAVDVGGPVGVPLLSPEAPETSGALSAGAVRVLLAAAVTGPGWGPRPCSREPGPACSLLKARQPHGAGVLASVPRGFLSPGEQACGTPRPLSSLRGGGGGGAWPGPGPGPRPSCSITGGGECSPRLRTPPQLSLEGRDRSLGPGLFQGDPHGNGSGRRLRQLLGIGVELLWLRVPG